jgi:outer membrane protein TolC
MLIPTAGPTQGKPQVLSPLASFSSLVLCVLFILLVTWPTMGWSAQARPETSVSPPVFQSPASFDELVRYALRESPLFARSSLEIQIRRLDEADSKSELFPSLYFTSRYYPSQPSNSNVEDPQFYYFALSTGDYNPLLAHLSVKARKVLTQIARLAHYKAVSVGIGQLGKSFLELSAVDRLVELQETLLKVSEENLRSAQERQRLGQIVPKEVEIIAQEVVVAKAQQEALTAYRARIRQGLLQFLGLKPGQPLPLDLRDAKRQVLGGFNPEKASLEEAQKRDFEVRIKKLSQELQTWKIALAKMKFMPSFNLILQTPDPVSSNINRGTYFSLGLNFPIFEGGRRFRDINRQKLVLKQFVSEEARKAAELLQDWQTAEQDLRAAGTELLVAQAKAKLARLKESQAETLYRTGEMDFTEFMRARRERIQAQIKVVRQAREHNLAALDLRRLSGELVDRYVKDVNTTS